MQAVVIVLVAYIAVALTVFGLSYSSLRQIPGINGFSLAIVVSICWPGWVVASVWLGFKKLVKLVKLVR